MVRLRHVLAAFGLAAASLASPASASDGVVVTTEASGGLLPGVSAAMNTSTCGGTAPLQTTCTAFGTSGSGSIITLGCRSTLAFTGYIVATVTTATGSLSFTCYFVGGAVVTTSPPVQSGRFVQNQSHTLSGAGVGAGGWQVYVYDHD